MPLPEPALVRIVDRIGAHRLSSDATLARVALKDLFPEDPLVVSVLTAAVEHGALAALLDDDRAVPLEVLGPRLANGLRRASGIDDARARWAIGAWASALGRLAGALPALPRDGSPPNVGSIFSAVDDEATLPATVPAAFDPTAATTEPRTGIGRTSDAAAGASDTALTEQFADQDSVPTERLRPVDEAGTQTLIVPVDDVTLVGRPPGEEPETTGSMRVEPTDSAATADTIIREAWPREAAGAVAAAPASSEDGTRPPPPRRGRRRLPVLLAMAAIVVIVAAAGLTMVLLRPPDPLTVTGSVIAATATSTSGSARLRAGSEVPKGAVVDVERGPLQLATSSGVIRLSDGASARVDGPAAVTLLDGRAFVHAGVDAVVVRSSAGTATVRNGRALVSCTDRATCTTATLDEPVAVADDDEAVTLRAHSTLSSDGIQRFVLPDALRIDAWVRANDVLDAQQHRLPTGIDGAGVLGDWAVGITRDDLPLTMKRKISFVRGPCDGTGCSIRATITMSDNVTGSDIVGTVVASSPTGDRISVDYGSHATRCQYRSGTTDGGGLDGAETVSDSLVFIGSGLDLRLTGTRTTEYTPTSDRCTTTGFSSPKTATLAGRRGSLAASDLTIDEQQSLLNYVVSPGSGCTRGTAATAASLRSDVRCTYAASGGGPTSAEFAVYKDYAGQVAAYREAIARFGLSSSGDCVTGPCERAVPGPAGRRLVAEDGSGAVLITYDPRDASLLMVLRGPTMAGLSAWWSAQQRSHSVYTASPLPRVGV